MSFSSIDGADIVKSLRPMSAPSTTKGHDMQPVRTARPWGLTRMRPFASPGRTLPARHEVDHETQVGIYYDHLGQVVAGPKHGSIRNTRNPRMTNLDGRVIVDGTDPDAEQD
ncbi:putative ATP-grasp target RiPP [Kribbella sp. VKM Ac-2527]|uniref:Putative ATP-grasp target RiPP n=2 Tax=Kribbella caucasensis TaxID=2512215 RepID=A0A4R6KQX0_9ACTN|nr:putative ATP-grasp target RiPP [Kribbella sp. VKM Ac-2527]